MSAGASSSTETETTKYLRVGVLFAIGPFLSVALGNSEKAFETFKSLQGKWAIQSAEKSLSIQMSYEVGSRGSIVTEQFGKELSVIYRDGQSLLMTHFCNAGNEPRLRLKESSKAGLLEFRMFDITNLKTKDAAHVERIIYRIIDARQIDLEIVWQKGKLQSSESYLLTRIGGT